MTTACSIACPSWRTLPGKPKADRALQAADDSRVGSLPRRWNLFRKYWARRGRSPSQDHDRGRPSFSHQPEQRQAIALRQADVGQHDVDRQGRHDPHGLLPVACGVHLVAGVAQHLRACQVKIGLVVDQQNAQRVPGASVGHLRQTKRWDEGERNKG
jgi:hypothetical protein